MTVATRPWAPLEDRRINAVWLGVVWLGLIAGFGIDLPRFFAERPPAPWIIHLHAVAMAGWMGLATVQVLLVETGRTRIHRKLGAWMGAYLVLILPLAIAAGLASEATIAGAKDADPQFIILNFVDVGSLGVLVAAGLFTRRDAPAHKRLMVLSLVAIADPGFARLLGGLTHFHAATPLDFWWGTFWGDVLLLAAMAGWDLWKWRRLHPAFIGGAVFLLAGEALTAVLYFDPGWKLIATGIVQAWRPIGG